MTRTEWGGPSPRKRSCNEERRKAEERNSPNRGQPINLGGQFNTTLVYSSTAVRMPSTIQHSTGAMEHSPTTRSRFFTVLTSFSARIATDWRWNGSGESRPSALAEIGRK
jgi:hypothetical protein